MVSFVIEFMEMYEQGNVIFIDGAAYAPAEHLAFALTKALCSEAFVVLVLVFLALAVIEFLPDALHALWRWIQRKRNNQ